MFGELFSHITGGTEKEYLRGSGLKEMNSPQILVNMSGRCTGLKAF